MNLGNGVTKVKAHRYIRCENCNGRVGFVAGMAVHVKDGKRVIKDHCVKHKFVY